MGLSSFHRYSVWGHSMYLVFSQAPELYFSPVRTLDEMNLHLN